MAVSVLPWNDRYGGAASGLTGGTSSSAGASGSGITSLAQLIEQYNAANGTSIDPNAPWTSPNWDAPNGSQTSLHALVNAYGEQQDGLTIGQIGALPLNGGGASSGRAAGSTSGGGAASGGSALPSAKNPDGSPIQTDPSGLAAGLLSGQQVASFQPAPYQDFGAPASIAPSTYAAQGYTATGYNPSNVDQTALPGLLQSYEGEVATALKPQFDAQKMSLDDNLASRGIVNSGAAVDLSQKLQGQQDAAYAGAVEPLIGAFAGYDQSNRQLNAQQQTAANAYGAEAQNAAARYGAEAGNAAGQFGAQAGNEAALFNAGQYANAVNYNANEYNNYQAGLLGSAEQYGNGLLSGFLGTYGTPNSQALATLGAMPGAAGAAYANAPQSNGLVNGVNTLFNSFSNPNSSASRPGSGDSGGNFVNGGNPDGVYGATALGSSPDGIVP